jgi:predicted O-methyltransferase YrrM
MLPEDLDRRIRAFQESRVLLTAIELDLFEALGPGATAAGVAETLGTDPRATEMLMNALVSLGLIEKRDGIFRNAPEATQHFTRRSPDDVRMAMMHTVHLWDRWSTLTECVRTGGTVQGPASGARREEWTTAFIAAMHANASRRAQSVVQAVDASRVRRMLDIGGGSGAYSIAFARANSELRAEILDVPDVVPIARRNIDAAGLADRVTAREGDLRAGGFGSGFDLVFISAICHMLGAGENREFVARASAALGPGGRIAIQDFILDPDRTGPRQAALFALNMLVGTRQGNTYTEEEYAGWMREAGCGGIRRVNLPGPADLMLGTRPA